jgi:hypothetical protein
VHLEYAEIPLTPFFGFGDSAGSSQDDLFEDPFAC